MKTALYALLALGAGTALLPAMAQGQAPNPEEKVSRVVIYGRDACPRGGGDEIVVCARRPESERFRIPEALREPSDNPENESWATRA